MSFRVLLTDRAWPDTTIEQGILESIGAEIVEPTTTGHGNKPDEATLIGLARTADAIAVNWLPLTPGIVNAATQCRIICRTGIGLDNIAVDAATAAKIPVTNVPDYCVEEVADHTLALILSLVRKVGFYHLRTKRGEYRLQAGPPLYRISGKTIGIVGLGKIARNLVPKLRALGLKILAHNRSGSDHGTGCELVPFERLLAASDIVSLHLPLSSTTHHLFNATVFQQMKPTAYLVNTSRGGLIDAAALKTALDAGHLAGAALDVFEPEPPDLALPPFQDERVILTPHAAFVSAESLIDLRTRVAKQIVAALQGQRPECVVNPQVYAGT